MERKVTSKRIRATKTYKYVLKKLSIGLVSVAVGLALIVPASAILAQETDASTVQNPPAEGQTTDANGSVDDVTATTKDTPGTTDLPADNGRSSDMQTFAENTLQLRKVSLLFGFITRQIREIAVSFTLGFGEILPLMQRKDVGKSCIFQVKIIH